MLSKQELEQQLEFNKTLMEQLTPYADREVRQLPESLQLEVKKIKVGPTVTTSGLEKVDDILTGLYLAIYNLEEASRDPEQFQKNYSKKESTATPPPPKPKPVIAPKISPKVPPQAPAKPSAQTPVKPIPKITIKLSEPEQPAPKSKPSPQPPPASSIKI